MNSESKVNPIGLLFLFAGTALAGSVLSFFYLWVNRVIPFIYLCVLAAVALGAVMGLVSAMIIKLFKIKTLALAITAVILGCLVFTCFKWALYVATDASSDISESYTEWYFFAFEDDFLNSERVLYSDSELREIITDMREMSAYEYIITYGQEELWELSLWDKEDLQILKDYTFYEYMGYYEYLSYGSVSDAVRVIIDEYNLSWFSYYNHLLKYQDYPTAIYYLTNPAQLINTIVRINNEGRWSYSASSFPSENSTSTNIRGIILWLIWLVEFFIICGFAVIAIPKAIRNLEPIQQQSIEQPDVNLYNGQENQYNSTGQTINSADTTNTANGWQSGGFGGGSVDQAEQYDEFGRPICQTDYFKATVNELPEESNAE
ncbi:MAG: DUF2157 domain-containing protein [Oscillospiraceae bacterium]|jgi:hypothetical protein|nr:DUF2157 domain-containing protein [Oscillospiraceae bacterium]